MIEISLHKSLNAPGGFMNLEVDFNIEKGEFVTLYGKSGAGKTSILRMIAGLFQPDKGKIIVNGNEWFNSSKKLNLPPQKRKIGFLFQEYALFPNMAVLQNLEYALKKNQPIAIINELIEVMELGDLTSLKPQTLSGGQKQRVALARALVQKPEVLLLDEPLSALDKEMRAKLQDYLLLVHQKYELTTILVSHDEAEVVKLSQKIFTLEAGKLTKQWTKEEFSVNHQMPQLQVKGKIIDIIQSNDETSLLVEIDNQIITYLINSNQASGLKVGQIISLNTSITSIDQDK